MLRGTRVGKYCSMDAVQSHSGSASSSSAGSEWCQILAYQTAGDEPPRLPRGIKWVIAGVALRTSLVNKSKLGEQIEALDVV